MLKSDKMNLIIALLVAIGLWVYVTGVENPEEDVPIRNVPIMFVNEDTLEDNDLVRLSSSDTYVTVTVHGRHSEATEVERGEIRVTADMEGLQAGENTVQLRVTGKPDNVEVKDLSKRKITVFIDEKITAEKNISASISGNAGDDREPYIIQLEKTEVEVTGAKSLVDSVKHISAVLDVKLVKNELRAVNVDLLPVDADGNTVEGVTLKDKSISITAVMLNKKTVPLNVPVVGTDADDAERTVTVPKTITVKGYASVLGGITSITAEPIDVSGVYTSSSTAVVPILPDGVEIASNSRNLKAEIQVSGLETADFTYGKEAVIIEGITEDMKVTMNDVSILLQIIGKKYNVDTMKKDDFYFIADVSGLEPGVHQVTLECQHNKTVNSLTFTPPEVVVTIMPREDAGEGVLPETESGDSEGSGTEQTDTPSADADMQE